MTRAIHPGPFGLDLDLTLSAGQAFGWRKEGDVWLKPLRAGLCAVSARGRRLLLRSAIPRREVARYFRLDDDFEATAARLARDPVLSLALERLPGLRLVREDPWECLASYLIAQNSTIRRTEAAVLGLARAFGRGRAAVPRFPEPEELARATLRELAPLRLGYRAPWLTALAREVARGGLDLEALREASYEEALGRLLALEGVGRKTADCVALYSLEKLEAFPIDTWIRKALERYYGVRGSDARLRAFAAERFGADAGYAQLYLFALSRREASKKKDPRTPVPSGDPPARAGRAGGAGRTCRTARPEISVGSEAPASLELRVCRPPGPSRSASHEPAHHDARSRPGREPSGERLGHHLAGRALRRGGAGKPAGTPRGEDRYPGARALHGRSAAVEWAPPREPPPRRTNPEPLCEGLRYERFFPSPFSPKKTPLSVSSNVPRFSPERGNQG